MSIEVMMQKLMKVATLSTLACLSILAVLGGLQTSANKNGNAHGKSAVTRNPKKKTAAQERVEKEYSEAFSTGVGAFRKGDLKTAERSLLNATRLRTNDDFSESFLAQVYQQEGNKALALETYRSALSTPNGRNSTVTHDPRILAGYGDACEEMGDLREARRAYAAAALREDFARPTVAVRSILNEDLPLLKRKAHGAAAAECRSVGDRTGAERHLRLGLQSDPKSWEAHLALAKVLRLEGKTNEAMASGVDAERLAGKSAPLVRQQRERMGLLRSTSTSDTSTESSLK